MGRNLGVRETMARGVHVPNATVAPILDEEDILRAIVVGLDRRGAAPCAHGGVNGGVNGGAHAGKGHVIFTLSVRARKAAARNAAARNEPGGDPIGVGGLLPESRLQLVDLGNLGSDETRSRSILGGKRGEANRSFTALTRCLAAMVDAAPTLGSDECRTPRAPTVPYRDSKLTWLLRDALGGGIAEAGVHLRAFARNRNGGMRTTLLACCATDTHALPATINTLRFAQRCRHASVWSLTTPEHEEADRRDKFNCSY